MILIIDTQLSPSLSLFLNKNFGVEAYSLQYLKMESSTNIEIYNFAHSKNAVVITKDEDFITLLDRFGSPPKIIWITIGNTSNQNMRTVLINKWKLVCDLLSHNDIVEIKE